MGRVALPRLQLIEVFDGSHEVAIRLAVRPAKRRRATASPALVTKRPGTHQNAEASALIFAPAFGLPPFKRERQGGGNFQTNS
jgi:hypothetical protein